MATYLTLRAPDGSRIQVDRAIRDGEGKNIANNYAKQDGAYQTLNSGNLIPTKDHNIVYRFDLQTTCGSSSTFNGNAVVKEIRGYTSWTNNTPVGAGITQLTSVAENLFNPTVGYAIHADNNATEYRISGTGVSTSTVVSINGVKCAITEKQCNYVGAPSGATYFSFTVPSGNKGGHITVNNYASISDLMIMLVWSGYNTTHAYSAYEEVDLIFDSSISSLTLHSLDTVYDYVDLNGKKLHRQLITNLFSGSDTFTAGTVASDLYPYTISIANILKGGVAQIGATNPITFDKSLGTNTPTSECFTISANGTLKFWLSAEHALTLTYSKDEAVVDAETFATELASKGALYTSDGTTYTSATEYTEGETYYYVSATTNTGAAYLNDLLSNMTLLAQRSDSVSNVTVTTNTYQEWDFGIEIVTYPSGLNYPTLVINYPLDIKATVQTLPSNYVSLESAENLLHQIGDLQGFDFDSISVDSTSQKMTVNGLVDTKETIYKADFIENATKFTHGEPTYNVLKVGANHIYFRFECEINILADMYYSTPLIRLAGRDFYLGEYQIHNDFCPMTVCLVANPLIMCKATLFYYAGWLGISVPSGTRGTYTLIIYGYMEKYK